MVVDKLLVRSWSVARMIAQIHSDIEEFNTVNNLIISMQRNIVFKKDPTLKSTKESIANQYSDNEYIRTRAEKITERRKKAFREERYDVMREIKNKRIILEHAHWIVFDKFKDVYFFTSEDSISIDDVFGLPIQL